LSFIHPAFFGEELIEQFHDLIMRTFDQVICKRTMESTCLHADVKSVNQLVDAHLPQGSHSLPCCIVLVQLPDFGLPNFWRPDDLFHTALPFHSYFIVPPLLKVVDQEFAPGLPCEEKLCQLIVLV
jgi:hypothetical protein